MTEATYAILLAGGQARRMGGGDKPLIRLAGQPILAWLLERLSPQCAGLILNANGEAARFSEFQLPVIADETEGFDGPLAGILAGLDWLARYRRGVAWALSVASDTPFIPEDLVSSLHAARLAERADIAVAASAGRTHPVVALWPVSIRSALRTALIDEDIRKIDRFTARFRLAHVHWKVAPFDPFFNVNSPQDLAAAEAIGQNLRRERNGAKTAGSDNEVR
jgi:molybdopterin-guanine dinucleotide biosynthesis protein A